MANIRSRVIGLEHRVQKAEPEVQCPECGGPAKVVLSWMKSGLPFSVDCLRGGHGRIFGLAGEDEEIAKYARISGAAETRSTRRWPRA